MGVRDIESVVYFSAVSVRPQKPRKVQWYSISVTSVQRAALLLLILAGAIGASLVYQRLMRDQTEDVIGKDYVELILAAR